MTPETKHTLTNLAVTLLLSILALMAVIGSGAAVFSPPALLSGSTDENHEEIRAQIHERDIIDYTALENGEVLYSYIGAMLPDKLADDEIVEKRTIYSYTRNLGTDDAGNPTFNLITYARPAFTKKDDVWYEIEYARVPADIFYKEYQEEAPLSFIFGRTARADTIYAGAGDGFVSYTYDTWATARGATTGTAADSTNTLIGAYSTYLYVKSGSNGIYRAFLPFNTSTIPATAAITGASLNVYVTAKYDGDNDTEAYMTVVRTSQATHTTLVTADYDNITTTEGIDSGERKDITGISTSAYLTFTLNATGIGWIAKSGISSNCSATAGITCLGLREGHDNTNTSIAQTFSSYSSGIEFSSSEASGTSQDPYLSVTYSDFSFWQFFGF